MRSRRAALTSIGPWIAVGILYFAATAPGPDYWNYRMWISAFDQWSIAGITGDTISPVNFPVTHWGPATGFFLFYPTILSKGLIPESWGLALSLGLMAFGVLAFFKRMLSGFSEGPGHSEQDSSSWIFWVALLLVGTQAGYYLRLGSTEIMVTVCMAAAIWVALTCRSVGLPELTITALAWMVLLGARPQAVPLLAPCLLLALTRFWIGSSNRERLLGFGIVGLMTSAGFAQSLLLNYWNTGHPLQSHYDLQDALYRHVDFSRAQIRAVLFGPLRGLFLYHPLYAVGLGCMAYLGVRERTVRVRIFWLLLLAAIASQVWLVSSVKIWHGGNSFGLRYFIGIAIPVVVACLRASTDLSEPHRRRFLVLLGICAAWSGVVLQADSLFIRTWHEWSAILPKLALKSLQGAFLAILAGLALRRLNPTSFAVTWRTILAQCLLGIYFHHLFRHGVGAWIGKKPWPVLVLLEWVWLLILFIGSSGQTKTAPLLGDQKLARGFLSGLATIIALETVMIWTFAYFAQQEMKLPPDLSRFEYRNTFSMRAFIADANEERDAEMLAFWIRQAERARLRPEPPGSQ